MLSEDNFSRSQLLLEQQRAAWAALFGQACLKCRHLLAYKYCFLQHRGGRCGVTDLAQSAPGKRRDPSVRQHRASNLQQQQQDTGDLKHSSLSVHKLDANWTESASSALSKVTGKQVYKRTNNFSQKSTQHINIDKI